MVVFRLSLHCFDGHHIHLTECSNYQEIDDSTRSRGYQSNSYKCDNSMATKWYRFRGASGNGMPTSCVSTHRCGTHAPGWLDGNHPTVAQGIVSAKVCFHWSNNCCRWSTYIRVRNCDGFFVYELKKPPVCHLRYCGNSGKERSGISKERWFYKRTEHHLQKL